MSVCLPEAPSPAWEGNQIQHVTIMCMARTDTKIWSLNLTLLWLSIEQIAADIHSYAVLAELIEKGGG